MGIWNSFSGRVTQAAMLLALAAPGRDAAAAAPELPVYAKARTTLWLDQGWNERERAFYHHVSQGTDTLPLPYAWFMALERPVVSVQSPGLLSDPDYLDRFGFIPSPRGTNNPAGLPIGFARTASVDPTNGKPFDQLGFTCAACHTGRIDYRGTAILIDGGPAMTDIGRFRNALGFALGLTALSPPRFLRFAERVLGRGYSPARYARLKLELARLVKEGVKLQIAEPSGRSRGAVEEGFGRLDALNRIGNEVFGTQLKVEQNYHPLTAPVAYPHIWGAPWFDWVQYNSSIEQPMVRNAGEAMGVRALVNYDGVAAPRFSSTIPVDRLHEIEMMLAGNRAPTKAGRFTGLRAPAWPENVLPRIDRTLAAQGAALYARHCSGCHLPAVGSDGFFTSDAIWTRENAAGERYMRLPLSPVTTIGTDPAQAVDMAARQVLAPLAFGFTGAVGQSGAMGRYSYGPALGQIVEKVVYHWYDAKNVPEADRQRMNGYRPNGIRNGIRTADSGVAPVYKARPLDGIWATAPYLHNGAVPTLWDLLSPYAERPTSFWLGNREYDPVKVGYVTTPLKGGFLLRATDPKTGAAIRGNGHGGHLFETPGAGAARRPGTIGPTLTLPERRALVEYLKTL